MDAYPCQHFSLSNPEGPASAGLPLLLRRLVDQIETAGIQSKEILDVTICGDEITEHGSSWRATVYWASDAEMPAVTA